MKIAVLTAAMIVLSGCLTNELWRNEHENTKSEETSNKIVVGFLPDNTVAIWSDSGKYRDVAAIFKLQDADKIPTDKVKSIKISIDLSVNGKNVYCGSSQAYITMDTGKNLMPESLGIIRANPINTILFEGGNITHVRRYEVYTPMSTSKVIEKISLTPLIIGADAVCTATVIALSPIWITMFIALPSLKISNM